MVEQLETPASIAHDLDEARRALDAFESGADRACLVGRLAAAHPLHPVIWAARAGLLMFVVLLGSVPVWTGSVAMGLPTPDLLMRVLESSQSFPAPLVLGALALCSLAFAAAMREAAAELGKDSPMLESEQLIHQKLTSEVMRHSARQVVEIKLRETPVPHARIA